MTGVQQPAVGSDAVVKARRVESILRSELWSMSVSVLTRAAWLQRTFVDGHREADDFADFLTSALAAVAANLGDVDLVTAGRPGSWESDLVDQLVRGAVGWDPEHLVARRTEPVVVPLNVAELVESSGCLESFFDAEAALVVAPDADERTREADWERLRARYLDAYDAYAQQFIAAVSMHALREPGLTVAPRVEGGELEVIVPVLVHADGSSSSDWMSTVTGARAGAGQTWC